MIFTIAIPVYNGGESLKKTIKSAINQNFSLPYEILISDNGSTDTSGEIIASYAANAKNLRVVTRSETVPMYENHNICLREAQGDYVVFCHADDFLINDCLNRFYQILQKRNYPDKYVLWGRSMFRDFHVVWQGAGIGLNNILAGQKAVIPFMFGGLAPSGVCYSRASLVELNGFCGATLRLTPFDMTTMFKMAIEGFEFEMADRLFFIRRYATTSRVLNAKVIKEITFDALQCLRNELDEKQFKFFVDAICQSNVFSFFIFSFFIKENLISKKVTRKLVGKKILKNPALLVYPKFYSEIKGMI